MKSEYGTAGIYIPDIDPAIYNILKHWAGAAHMPLSTLTRFILTDAAQKKVEGKIKLTHPPDMSNTEWLP